jgi:hypothetical protein
MAISSCGVSLGLAAMALYRRANFSNTALAQIGFLWQSA